MKRKENTYKNFASSPYPTITLNAEDVLFFQKHIQKINDKTNDSKRHVQVFTHGGDRYIEQRLRPYFPFFQYTYESKSDHFRLYAPHSEGVAAYIRAIMSVQNVPAYTINPEGEVSQTFTAKADDGTLASVNVRIPYSKMEHNKVIEGKKEELRASILNNEKQQQDTKTAQNKSQTIAQNQTNFINQWGIFILLFILVIVGFIIYKRKKK